MLMSAHALLAVYALFSIHERRVGQAVVKPAEQMLERGSSDPMKTVSQALVKKVSAGPQPYLVTTLSILPAANLQAVHLRLITWGCFFSALTMKQPSAHAA